MFLFFKGLADYSGQALGQLPAGADQAATPRRRASLQIAGHGRKVFFK